MQVCQSSSASIYSSGERLHITKELEGSGFCAGHVRDPSDGASQNMYSWLWATKNFCFLLFLVGWFGFGFACLFVFNTVIAF